MSADPAVVEMLLPFPRQARLRCWLRGGYDTLTSIGEAAGLGGET